MKRRPVKIQLPIRGMLGYILRIHPEFFKSVEKYKEIRERVSKC